MVLTLEFPGVCNHGLVRPEDGHEGLEYLGAGHWGSACPGAGNNSLECPGFGNKDLVRCKPGHEGLEQPGADHNQPVISKKKGEKVEKFREFNSLV